MRKTKLKSCIPGCKVYTSYIRIQHQWRKVGQYHTICGKFSRLEVEKEEQRPPEAKPDDVLSEGIRFFKNRPSPPPQIQAISDNELSELCNSI